MSFLWNWYLAGEKFHCPGFWFHHLAPIWICPLGYTVEQMCRSVPCNRCGLFFLDTIVRKAVFLVYTVHVHMSIVLYFNTLVCATVWNFDFYQYRIKIYLLIILWCNIVFTYMYLAHNLILTPSYISWLTMRVNGLKKKSNKNFLSCSIKMVHLKWWILTKKHKRIFLMQTEQSNKSIKHWSFFTISYCCTWWLQLALVRSTISLSLLAT